MQKTDLLSSIIYETDRRGRINKQTKIKSVAVLGVGSLGGFFADSIAKLDGLEDLVIVDYDVVKEKNLDNSIYRSEHIDMKKIDALERYINNRNLNIVKVDSEFFEGITQIPDCDLVFDCRDFVYDRCGGIDARLYISGRYLIVDCKRIAKHSSNYEGRYRESLTRIDIAVAGMAGARLVSDMTIIDLIQKQAVYKYDLDCQKQHACNKINSLKKNSDVLCDIDQFQDGEKIVDLADNLYPIIEENKKRDVLVHVNSLEKPLITKVIPKNKLKTYNDVAKNLTSLISSPLDYQQYSIDIKTTGKMTVIVLLPETGGA